MRKQPRWLPNLKADGSQRFIGIKSHKPECIKCGGLTKFNKFYCSLHVTESPYIKEIMRKIEEQENELQTVRDTKSSDAIKEESLTVSEVIQNLNLKGARTLKGLSKDLSIDTDILVHYISYLSSIGLVTVEKNKRKNDKVIRAST